MDLQQIIDGAKRIVFFGGAGVSTESGIPDFRSQDGLYNQSYAYPPETILSHTFFERNPEEFFRFYREKILVLDVEPNKAHKKLAEMEAAGKLNAVVTQNIDGLHQRAGSKRVYELHGSIHRNHCTRCGRAYTAREIAAMKGVPHCDCGGVIKPDVVLYEEPLDEKTMMNALRAIRQADVMIVAGTSLTVYPAAGFLSYFSGSHLVLINRDPTPADRHADLVIHDKVGEVLGNTTVR